MQSLISKVTKKRVGFNLKIFVFALLKTVQNRAERNPGPILRLFNCNDRCFFIWREAPKPKCLPGLVSPHDEIHRGLKSQTPADVRLFNRRTLAGELCKSNKPFMAHLLGGDKFSYQMDSCTSTSFRRNKEVIT